MTTPDQARASRERILAQTPPDVRGAIERIVGANSPRPTFVVGGAVRDALLGRDITDLDLVTEGDALAAVRQALPSWKIVAHEKFGTASVKIAGVTIDVVTARREVYPRPGALPRVEPSTIDDDLRRRDFTINAMAVRLDAPGDILDPMGGLEDLQHQNVRVLHPKSFEDDATRIYRALRYATRLGFHLDQDTSALLKQGLGLASTISGARLRRELELMLREPRAGEALLATHDRRGLSAIHPALSWDKDRSDALHDPSYAAVARVPFGFALMAAHATPAAANEIVERLRLHRDEAAAVTEIASMRDIGRTLRRPGAKPSGIVVLLDRYPATATAAFAATADDPIARQLALRYLDEWQHVKPLLHGNDLVDLGVPSGPQIQKALQLIRAARLDGWATDEGDERALALRFAKSIRDSAAANADIELHANGH